MSQVLDQPLLGLDVEFPRHLYVLHHPATGRYGCYNHQGIHGLACFSFEDAAVKFSELIDLSGMTIVGLSFEEARDVAKARPLPVVALMLLDQVDKPTIHYVK